MKKRLFDYFIKGKRFKREFKKQLRLLILFTLGFTIAFTWRQTIFDLSQSLIQFLIGINNTSTLSILASVFITIISILLIYLTSYYLKDNPNDY